MFRSLKRWLASPTLAAEAAIDWKAEGDGHLAAGRWPEAERSYRRALEQAPGDAGAWLNLGHVLLELRREDEALAAYRAALAQDPALLSAAINAGSILQGQNRYGEAVATYETVLAREPRHAVAHWNLALCKLVQGDLETGWREAEWRWEALQREPMRFAQPMWTGEQPLAGRTVFVHSEQGLGDSIQFARYLPLLAERGAKVLLNVQPPLERLLGALPGVERLVREGEPVPRFDTWLPVMSLPLAFRTTLATIPAPVPYLHAEAGAVEAWRKRLGPARGLRVGIVWSGSPGHVNDANRSMPLAQLAGALARPGVELVSLHKELRERDRPALAALGIAHFGDELADLADTAALAACMDLVVSVDTSVAHLAGALGLPVWILLPFAPDWRWLLARSDTPWYPQARLFRQAQAGRWDEALHALERALHERLQAPGGHALPAAATATAQALARGNAALGRGELEAAESCYREALAAAPQDAAAHVNLGYVLLERGRTSEAADLLAALLADPGGGGSQRHDAAFLLARARQALGDRDGAIAALREALAARPGFVEAMEVLVPLLLQTARAAEALPLAQQLAALRPTLESGVQLAHAHYACGQDAQALDILDSVLAASPQYGPALTGRGHALLRLGRYEAAAGAFQQALAQGGATADRLVDLASAYHRLGRIDEAQTLQQQALAQEPAHAAALNLQVVVLTRRLQLAEAEALAREALRRHPDDADLHWSLAIALLLQGKLAEGWAEHRWRWKASVMATSAPAARPEPAWQGESLQSRSILLTAEQGFGDTLQFARYVPLVAAAAARVLLQAPPALHGLLRGLAPGCELAAQVPAGAADVQCALMDLPHVFGTTIETVPPPARLTVPEEQVAQWAQRVRDGSRRLHVGVAWSGNPAHTNDRHRSIPLADFARLFDTGCRFVSLQPQLREEDAAVAAARPELLQVGGALRDFVDTAAAIRALDLVVTVDTSVAHLAGSLGVPVWILLPHCPDWRWMVGRDDSPWYPSARLVRQAAPGDWAGVLARVAADLRAASAARAQ